MKKLTVNATTGESQIIDLTPAEVAALTPTAEQIDACREAALDSFDLLAFRFLFNHENRVRALEGKNAITATQFRTALKAMLD